MQLQVSGSRPPGRLLQSVPALGACPCRPMPWTRLQHRLGHRPRMAMLREALLGSQGAQLSPSQDGGGRMGSTTYGHLAQAPQNAHAPFSLMPESKHLGADCKGPAHQLQGAANAGKRYDADSMACCPAFGAVAPLAWPPAWRHLAEAVQRPHTYGACHQTTRPSPMQ